MFKIQDKYGRAVLQCPNPDDFMVDLENVEIVTEEELETGPVSVEPMTVTQSDQQEVSDDQSSPDQAVESVSPPVSVSPTMSVTPTVSVSPTVTISIPVTVPTPLSVSPPATVSPPNPVSEQASTNALEVPVLSEQGPTRR